MKAKLVKKTDGWYNLYDGEIGIGSTHPELQGHKLSKQNCDKIFGVTDVEKLAMGYDLYEKINFVGQTRAYKAGFNKAMELNKDKVFTLEDMRKAMDWIITQYFEFHEQPSTGRREHYLQLLQQPIAIEVEIETETKVWEFISNGEFESFEIIPKLDSNGCLILKKL
jgi:hypothetical protein